MKRNNEDGQGRIGAEKANDVVATRTFKLRGGGSLIARFYRPIRIRAHEWAAPFVVEGLAEEYRDRALGADSLQALLLAADALRNWLEEIDVKFTWLGGEMGYTGIPRTIVDVFGLAFSKHAEQLVKAEAIRYVEGRAEERRAQAKRRKVTSVTRKLSQKPLPRTRSR